MRVSLMRCDFGFFRDCSIVQKIVRGTTSRVCIRASDNQKLRKLLIFWYLYNRRCGIPKVRDVRLKRKDVKK